MDQPETGTAPQPWFDDELAEPHGAQPPPTPSTTPSTTTSTTTSTTPSTTTSTTPSATPSAKPTAPRSVEVQPLSDDVLGAQRQPSWLLELDGDTPADALPEVGSSEPVAPLTSYVEPETTGTLVSRALAPAGLALVLSFLAVGGFAFWKSGGSVSVPVGADPLDADPGVVSGRRAAELVAPPRRAGSSEPTRVGTLRAGAVPSAPPLGQQSARPSPGSSPPVETPAWSPPAADTTSSSIALDAELRSAVITPVPVLEPETVNADEGLAGEVGDAATAAITEPLEEADAALVVELLVAESTSVAGLDTVEVSVFESRTPLDLASANVTDTTRPSHLFDQFFGVIVGAGAAASLAAPEVTSEPALAPGEDLDVVLESPPMAALEEALHASTDPSDPAPVFTCDEDPAELAMGGTSSEDSLAGVRLDLDWDDLVLAVESDPASDPARLAAQEARDITVLDPVATLAAPVLDIPSLDTLVLDTLVLDTLVLDTLVLDTLVLDTLAHDTLAHDTLAHDTLAHDTLALLGPPLDSPVMDWATLDGPTPDPATLGDSSTGDPTPSVALERRSSSDVTVPAESFGPEAPPYPIREGGGWPTGVDPRSSALAAELDGLLAMAGPHPRPVDAQETVEPYVETQAAPLTPLAPEATGAGPPTLDVPVEIMPPVATPSTDKGHRSVLRRADDSGTWTALDVPNAVVVGSEFLLTPYTGNVRVVFDRGDVFEGRLHAVGQNRIDLDTRLGRMTLDARRLQRIERLAPEGPAPKSPSKVANDTSGLEEVRVTTRGGGTFQGHLVSRDGNKVTLIVVEGYRMTVEAVEVTPAVGGRGNSSLRRPGDKGAAPVRPAKRAPPAPR